MANSLKKVMRPILKQKCSEAYQEGYKQGVASGYRQKSQSMAPKWIPVTERLPDEGDRCLCRLKSFAFPGSFYQMILRYDKLGFRDGGVYEDGVTHWMPLPEPPKEV